MAHPLQNYQILIADSDVELAHVLRDMLRKMGFEHIELTRSGNEAFRMLQAKPIDLLVTEWNTQEMDGLNLIRNIRRSPSSLRPTLPVLMLTGRAEASDVIVTRDCGVNEYIIKPFTARSIFNRLERVIEQPRRFVVTQSFVGPSRRHQGEPPAGKADRRRQVLIPKLQPTDTAKAIVSNTIPKLWLPDFSLKYKLGSDTLKSLITPEVLNHAQAAIDASGTESMLWIRDNLNELGRLCDALAAESPPSHIGSEIGEVALSINARAGTFGYGRAAEIAYMLYLFCRSQFQLSRPGHRLTVRKFREVLEVIFGNGLKGDAGVVGAQIIVELRNLIAKNS